MPLIDPVDRAAIRVLRRRLGLWGTLKVGWAVERAKRRGEPFAHLAPAEDEKERGSRAQAGPAIVLYRALRGRLEPRRALAITGDVIEAAALVFLAQTIGPLKRAELNALDDAERRAFVEERGARFPNATAVWDHVGTDAVRFTIHSCRFVELCAETGVPELAPAFCKGDATYFGSVEPDVVLIRETTLASGGDRCPFELRWQD